MDVGRRCAGSSTVRGEIFAHVRTIVPVRRLIRSRLFKAVAGFVAALIAILGALAAPASAFTKPSIAFVPLDDRPVTLQLPRMLGAIAGIDVRVPPRATIGRYLTPGDPDAVMTWLTSDDTRDAFATVVSSDMIVYGGLIASRTPAVPSYVAISRLRALADARDRRRASSFTVFGTVMRLAPTGVPAIGDAKTFFAAGPTYDLITEYANLPDPPQTTADRAKAAELRAQIGAPLDGYLRARSRDRDVDLFLLQLLAEGRFDRVVLGQDDAGPQGLHLRDLAALRSFAAFWGLRDRSSIEPGADELGMALVARAVAAHAAWSPAVDVTYSRANGASVNDPLEFAPIDTTIGDLIATCGAHRVAGGGDIALFVRVSGTSDADERAFVDAVASAVDAGRLVAVADLTFLDGTLDEQRALVQQLVARRLAGRVAAFASWNTTANTVGTALPEAIVAGAGRRMGTYDRRAHVEFALDRYADDYAFHDFVRPQINRELAEHGIEDHTYLLPGTAQRIDDRDRALLWPLALDLLHEVAPEYRDSGLTIRLPWNRTFETSLDVRLAPSPAHAALP